MGRGAGVRLSLKNIGLGLPATPTCRYQVGVGGKEALFLTEAGAEAAEETEEAGATEADREEVDFVRSRDRPLAAFIIILCFSKLDFFALVASEAVAVAGEEDEE